MPVATAWAVLIGSVLFYALWELACWQVKLLRYRRLKRDGTHLSGSVKLMFERRFSKYAKAAPFYRIGYEFNRPENGVKLLRESRIGRKNIWSQFESGQMVDILYDHKTGRSELAAVVDAELQGRGVYLSPWWMIFLVGIAYLVFAQFL